jgi:hypothetical protein
MTEDNNPSPESVPRKWCHRSATLSRSPIRRRTPGAITTDPAMDLIVLLQVDCRFICYSQAAFRLYWYVGWAGLRTTEIEKFFSAGDGGPQLSHRDIRYGMTALPIDLGSGSTDLLSYSFLEFT